MDEQQIEGAEESQEVTPIGLKPFEPENLGLFAPFEISPEPMYTQDSLGDDLAMAIKSMAIENGKFEDAARLFELMQAAEARLMDRGYFWLTPAKNGEGWNIAGSTNLKGSGVMANLDAKKLWGVNIYGARKDKIVAALTVKDPEPEFFPKRPDNAIDQQAAEQSTKYKHLWKQATNVRGLCNKIGGLFYTDDRTALITESVADAQRFGMEGKDPGVGEVTRAYGKLEIRVPMSIDEEDPLPWIVRSRELDKAVAKEKYYWIADKISGGSGVDGSIARTCRITVRNAVNGQVGVTSNASDRAVTESTYWVRPSQYRDIPDEDQRKACRDNFPDGMRIVFAGENFAYCRNEKMDDCVVLLYSREGTGQNRRAIGTNNLTTQKVLNYDYTLFQKYMARCIPRKIHSAEAINPEAMTQQNADPSYSMPIANAQIAEAGGLANITAVENVPTPPAQLMDFIQLHIEGLPEAMDGASPSMFGGTDGTDTVGGITIQRDQALQVFGTPYNAMTWGIAKACQQAAKWAGKNRSGEVSAMIPSAGRITVNMDALQGDTYCFPQADSGFPESEAEKEQKLMDAIDASASFPALQQALADPSNFPAIETVTKRFNIMIPGADSVRKQQEEFEILLSSAPVPNPAYSQAQQQLAQVQQQAQSDPQSQNPEGQAKLQQLQQAVQSVPQLLPSVPVEQDASVNHQVEAATCFTRINSPEGQKLKREQPPSFQNLMLHWQGHTDMASKLAPPPAMPEVKPGVTLAVDKLGPVAQTAVLLKEYGITVAPQDVTPPPPNEDVHEIVQEKQGVDAAGVPVKQEISYSGKPLQ